MPSEYISSLRLLLFSAHAIFSCCFCRFFFIKAFIMKWKHKQCLATQWTPTPFPSILVMCERWSTSFHSIQVHIAMAFCEHFTLNTFLFQNWKTENQKDKIAKIKWRTLKASNMACSMDRFSKCTWLRQLMLLFGFVVLFLWNHFWFYSHIYWSTHLFFSSLWHFEISVIVSTTIKSSHWMWVRCSVSISVLVV